MSNYPKRQRNNGNIPWVQVHGPQPGAASGGSGGQVVIAEDYPDATTIPDEIDTTDGTVIYLGYRTINNVYLIAKRTIATSLISTKWATGSWSNRVNLF